MRIAIIPVALLPFLGPGVSMADDVTALTEKCAACHGPEGHSEQPDVPVIAGFSRQGFIDNLEAFRQGERVAIEFHLPDSPAVMMNDIARELSDAQVEMLADYYSAQTFRPRKQDFDEQLAREGAAVHERLCERCHSSGGSDPQDDAAILAGQWTPYLRRQFANIDDGKRIVPRAMLKKYRRLNDDEKEPLLHYYASQQ